MKMRTRPLVAAVLLGLGFCTPIAAAEPPSTWLINATRIYRAPDAPPLDGGSVLIRGGKIAAVGKKGSFPVPPDARVSDCADGVLTAGFQNNHVHFTEPEWNNAGAQPAATLAQLLERKYTRYGFTTVLDTASDYSNTHALRQRINRGEVRGPRILTAGLALYPPNGIPIYLRDYPPELLAKFPQPETATEAARMVRENLGAGAEVTKLFLVTPQGRGVVKRMPSEIAAIAAKETHARGKLVIAHPTDLGGVRAAVDAAVDVLVHTTLGEKQPWDEPLVKRMVQQRMSVIPTFTLWRIELQKDDVPSEVIERLIGATQQELRTFAAAGGQVLFGTDAGYTSEFETADEYVYMSGASMTPMQILASLTTESAARFEESKRRGRVDVGLDADLVMLRGDPATDVKNFAAVRCVFRNGELLYSSAGE